MPTAFSGSFSSGTSPPGNSSNASGAIGCSVEVVKGLSTNRAITSSGSIAGVLI